MLSKILFSCILVMVLIQTVIEGSNGRYSRWVKHHHSSQHSSNSDGDNSVPSHSSVTDPSLHKPFSDSEKEDSKSDSKKKDSDGKHCGLNPRVRSALATIISSWYFTQIDNFIKDDDGSLENFNKVIPKVYDCSSKFGVDVCVNTASECAIFEASSCEDIADPDSGYYHTFAEVLRGIVFGQVCNSV